MASDISFKAADGAELRPVDGVTADLAARTQQHLEEMAPKAEASLAHQDETLKSEFNPHDIYKDVSYYQRCGKDGRPDEQGGFFRGIELNLYSSMDDVRDCVVVEPTPDGKFRLFFGGRRAQVPEGLLVETHDKYNTFRLEKQIVKALKKVGCEVSAERKNEKEHLLRAAKTVEKIYEVTPATDEMVIQYLFRTGLESRSHNLMKRLPNFLEITDANVADWVKYPDELKDSYKNIVIITATRICRRCTREWPEITAMVKEFPQVHFGIAFIDKPKFKFMPKVFDEDCGEVRFGDQVTPFVIFYKAGIFQEYIATRKEEPPPDMNEARARVRKYFLS